MNIFSPRSASSRLRRSKPVLGMYTSPRTSNRSGALSESRRMGIVRMVRNVFTDVLATVAVAAGGTLDQATLLVDQRHRQTVDLRFADHGQAIHFRQVESAAMPGPQSFKIEGVAQ